ncbi:hypothetical protein K438DRAFT_1944958 [Mycena galopus ATCC 62051]|nr:hypothetical protein K438DRAFT_1944958 [Mycena galopus ATCC 62051]
MSVTAPLISSKRWTRPQHRMKISLRSSPANVQGAAQCGEERARTSLRRIGYRAINYENLQTLRGEARTGYERGNKVKRRGEEGREGGAVRPRSSRRLGLDGGEAPGLCETMRACDGRECACTTNSRATDVGGHGRRGVACVTGCDGFAGAMRRVGAHERGGVACATAMRARSMCVQDGLAYATSLRTTGASEGQGSARRVGVHDDGDEHGGRERACATSMRAAGVGAQGARRVRVRAAVLHARRACVRWEWVRDKRGRATSVGAAVLTRACVRLGVRAHLLKSYGKSVEAAGER